MEDGWGVGGGGRSDSAKWKNEGQREVCEGESNAFEAGGNNIYTLAAVVGKGWAKGKSAIPMRGPSVAVFGTGEGKTELARGVNRGGGEVVWETVEAGPGREWDRGARDARHLAFRVISA